MDLLELVEQGDGAAELDTLAQGFGLSREQTEAVVSAVLPEVARRLERSTLSRGGVADLIGMLGQVQGLPQVGSAQGLAQGNALLEQVFGTKDTSRAVAARASLTSGIGASIIQAMLPYIIQMVMGSFARRTSGGLGDILSKIPNLGGGSAPAPQGGGAGFPFPGGGGTGGGSGGGGFGFPTGGGSSGGGSPLPGPEGMSAPGRNPYGDLSDVIRRGGTGARVDGSPLWRIVRSILGSALGFQSRGIVSWIVRMVVMRYGWSFLTTILRRVVLRR